MLKKKKSQHVQANQVSSSFESVGSRIPHVSRDDSGAWWEEIEIPTVCAESSVRWSG